MSNRAHKCLPAAALFGRTHLGSRTRRTVPLLRPSLNHKNAHMQRNCAQGDTSAAITLRAPSRQRMRPGLCLQRRSRPEPHVHTSLYAERYSGKDHGDRLADLTLPHQGQLPSSHHGTLRFIATHTLGLQQNLRKHIRWSKQCVSCFRSNAVIARAPTSTQSRAASGPKQQCG